MEYTVKNYMGKWWLINKKSLLEDESIIKPEDEKHIIPIDDRCALWARNNLNQIINESDFIITIMNFDDVLNHLSHISDAEFSYAEADEDTNYYVNKYQIPTSAPALDFIWLPPFEKHVLVFIEGFYFGWFNCDEENSFKEGDYPYYNFKIVTDKSTMKVTIKNRKATPWEYLLSELSNYIEFDKAFDIVADFRQRFNFKND